MHMTVVGCSGSAPGPDSACSSYLVEADGYRLLLDLGAGAAGPLQRYVEPGDIDLAILSHAHSDHYADLTQLWRLRVVTGAAPLPVIGPSDMPSVLRDPGAFAASVAESGERKAGSMSLRLARVEHGECWATRIDEALCYTADSEPCAALDELAYGCRVLLAEGSGTNSDRPMRGHLTAGDAARLSVRSGAKLLVLTHLRPWQDPVELLDEAAQIADCPVILARSGLRVAL
jgi:ribonuclease BN (tRNA processing enzyme)